MKPEQWVTSLGIIFIVGLIIGALLPDDFWNREHSSHHGVSHRLAHVVQGAVPADVPRAPYPQQADVAQPAWTQQGVTQAPAAGMQPPYPGVVTSPATQPQVRNIAATGLTPFTAAKTSRYEGAVQQIMIRGPDLDWNQVHIWIAEPAGAPREISLAPDWYLQYMGCMVNRDMRVTGLAFQFDRATADAVLYAKDIVVNGRKCQLRNDEGFALWSNKLR